MEPDYPLAVYQQYFSKIFGAAEHGGNILTHVPVHPGQLEKRYARNLHGHMHSKRVMLPTAFSEVPDERYVCVSVEHTGLAPILMDSVRVPDQL